MNDSPGMKVQHRGKERLMSNLLGHGPNTLVRLGMSEWTKNPFQPLKDSMTSPLIEAMKEVRRQLEADKAALREFEARLERVQKKSP